MRRLGSKGTEDYWAVEYTQEMADRYVKESYESGVTYFDTAEDYAAGDSEVRAPISFFVHM
jgi:aryl-alcohol dehydrogenase-like predicted oxidoreductase